MIVIAVLAGVTTLAVIKYKDYSTRAGMTNATSYGQSIKDKVMLYYASKESFPPTATGATTLSSALNYRDPKNAKYIANINYVNALDSGAFDPSKIPANILSQIGGTNNVLGYIELDLPAAYQATPGTNPANAAKLYLVASSIGDKVEWNQYSVGVSQVYQPQGFAVSCPGNQVFNSATSTCQCANSSQYHQGGYCLPVPANASINATKDGFNCNSGYGHADTSCNQCGIGTVSAGGTQGCTACPAGQFAATAGLAACTSCTSMPGVASCLSSGAPTACNPGYGLSGTTCTQCTTNQFSTGSSPCASCLSTGVASCNSSTGQAISCNAGYGLVGGACSACTSGSYSTAGTTTACVSCTSMPGVASCSSTGGATRCNAGYGLSAGACNLCNAGQYSNGSGPCASCLSTGVASCNSSTGQATSCNAGYGLVGGACTPCASGSYSTAGTTSACVSCTSMPGVASCSSTGGATRCNAGYGLVGGSCAACGTNQYSNGSGPCASCLSTGVAACNSTTGQATSCNTNYGFSSGTCTACTSGMTSTGGTSSCANTCPAGTSTTGTGQSAGNGCKCTNPSTPYWYNNACVSCPGGSVYTTGGYNAYLSPVPLCYCPAAVSVWDNASSSCINIHSCPSSSYITVQYPIDNNPQMNTSYNMNGITIAFTCSTNCPMGVVRCYSAGECNTTGCNTPLCPTGQTVVNNQCVSASCVPGASLTGTGENAGNGCKCVNSGLAFWAGQCRPSCASLLPLYRGSPTFANRVDQVNPQGHAGYCSYSNDSYGCSGGCSAWGYGSGRLYSDSKSCICN